MNKKFLMLPLLFGFLLFNSPALMAGTAIQEMVGILLHLHHHPSDSEKATLEKIVNDSSASANERTIASALMNMNHHVSADDRAKLRQIADDGSAPMADRTVAGILATINHKPSESDMEELEKLK